MRTPIYNVEAKRDFAAAMRKKPTLAERTLWYRLHKKQTGFIFHRQSLQRGYILDFYCPRLRLAIEVDGSIHDLPGHAEADAKKEEALRDYGIKVLRFTNQDVLDFISVVMVRIETTLKALSPCSAVSGTQNADSSRSSQEDSSDSRRSATTSKPVEPHSQSEECAKPSDQPATGEDYGALIAAAGKLERCDRNRSFAFDARTSAERAFDQKYRLQQWLKKHRSQSVPADDEGALALKGMQVVERKA